MSVSPFDNSLLSGLLGDDDVAATFSSGAEFKAMNDFEMALARAEAAEGIIPEAAAEAISLACTSFAPDQQKIAKETARDGVIVPEYLRQCRERLAPEHCNHLHFGATSQDVIDTALILRLRPVLETFDARLARMIGQLDALAQKFGKYPIMGRTRMQDGLPITIADRLAAWRGPLIRDRDRLAEFSPRLLVLQFGGAVGTTDKLGAKSGAVARHLGVLLNLGVPEKSWHNQRDNVAELANWLSLVTGSLGKIGTDITLMAQNAIGEITLSGGGGSSAMPHKSNPVAAEILVSLARFNATLLPAMHHALVHEQERSGAAWTLEWLTLPQMVMTAATSLRTAIKLLDQITMMGRQ